MNYQLSVSTDPTNWEAELVVPGSPLCAQLGPAQGSVAQDTPEVLGLFHPLLAAPCHLPVPCYLGRFSVILPYGQPSLKELAITEALFVSAGLVRTTENKP